jgi:anaerobic magnesium-protoporphyrin IX monomethyl ester cyclase
VLNKIAGYKFSNTVPYKQFLKPPKRQYLCRMRVLLTTLNAKYIHSNLAIRILYQLNKDYPHLAWKEFTIKQDPGVVANHCAGFDLVAFSCYIWNIRQTINVIGLIRQINPNVKILLGGPEVSYEYDSLVTGGHADYIIAGEGETAFREFLDCYPDIEEVPGLVRLHDGVVKSNPVAAPFDVNELAKIMPYAGDEPESLAPKVLYIETSRGCPYKCEFCLASLDNKVRYLPDGAIRATLLHLMTHGKTIKFLDRTFNIKKDFTIAIFRFILENHCPGNVFQFEITADILHPDIIRFIRDNVPPGLFRFEIGIQSVNTAANLSVKRKQNFEKTKQIIQQLADKVEMHLDLIVGLPLDRFDDIRHSFSEVFRLHPPELQLGFLKFLKGTPMRTEHSEHEYAYSPDAPYEIVRSKYLSETDLDEIRCLEEGLEVYWNGRKATRLLKYVDHRYSAFDFLLHLGKQFRNRFKGVQYSLTDSFDLAWEEAGTMFAGDKKAQELLAIDYYMYNNEKPKARYISAFEPTGRELVSAHARHLAIPIRHDPDDHNLNDTAERTAVFRYAAGHPPVMTVHVAAN